MQFLQNMLTIKQEKSRRLGGHVQVKDRDTSFLICKFTWSHNIHYVNKRGFRCIDIPYHLAFVCYSCHSLSSFRIYQCIFILYINIWEHHCLQTICYSDNLPYRLNINTVNNIDNRYQFTHSSAFYSVTDKTTLCLRRR